MIAWIAENAATLIALSAVLAVIGLAVFAVVRERKARKKKGGCTGNCATCGMGCSCGKTERN